MFINQHKPNLKQDSSASSALQRLPWIGNFLRFGMGETLQRLGLLISFMVMVGVIVWLMQRFYLKPAEALTAAASAIETAPEDVVAPLPNAPLFDKNALDAAGLTRLAFLHTILPVINRTEVLLYEVAPGDNIFSIAEKFNLKPETLLWGNRYTLGDNPHLIVPGQQLNILPVNGVYHQWNAGEGLNGVAGFYQVTPEDIINYPGNRLDPATIGDYANPNIEPDTMLVIPGGVGTFIDYTPRITREEPATAQILGAGACTGSYEGISGSLSFIWPTTERYLSGFDYTPAANHFGIDIAGAQGNPVYAADSGVVVYAGYNDYGYGEMVVIDHGYGWQTLYAHLSVINVSCGQEVIKGETIGLVGNTGNSSGAHLHFEIRQDEYGRLNPWDYLR